jgi:hypothetical protein
VSIARFILENYILPLPRGTVFIESGARWGDTVIKAVELGAKYATSCEIDILQHAMAWVHVNDALPNNPRWSVQQASSPRWLREHSLACYRNEPDLVIFLDAHAERQSPLLDELKAIAECGREPLAGLTLLIDDVRIIKSGAWGFGMAEVFAAISEIGPCEVSYDVGVEKDDILVARFK